MQCLSGSTEGGRGEKVKNWESRKVLSRRAKWSRTQGSHPAGLVAAVRAVGHGVGATVDVLGAVALTAACRRKPP